MPRGERHLLLVLLAAFAVLDAAVLWSFAASLRVMYPDFFGTWSFAKFIASHPPAGLYVTETLVGFQRELAPGFRTFFPYAYPPSYLLLITPLGWMPFALAAVCWIGLTFAAFLAVVLRLLDLRGGTAVWAAAVLLLMPTTMLGVVYGQSGFLTAALLIGGMLWVPTRPFLAGLVLGLLTVKPQLGVLVPVALLAAGAWRAIGGAIAGAAALVLISMAVHGGGIWLDWIDSLGSHAAAVAAMGDRFHAIMATPLAGFLLVGAPRPLAMALHVLCALFAIALVWKGFRRGVTPLATAALLVGTFLVTPYGFTYDTPMVTAAVFLLCVTRYRAGERPLPGELAILVFALAAPCFVLADAHVPMVPASLLLLCWLISRRLRLSASSVATS